MKIVDKNNHDEVNRGLTSIMRTVTSKKMELQVFL